MIEEGMAVPDGEEPLFAIYPEILGDAKKPVRLSVLKIRNVERLVIEQHKLYSIKEHESKRKTAPVIEVPPEDLDIPEITPSTTHQKRFESSLDTVGRVLGNITLAQRETWEEETAVQPPHQEERSPGDIAPIDEANVQVEPEQVDQPHFDCEAARFIQEAFDFEVQNGAVLVPKSDVQSVINSMSKADWTISSAKKAISSSSEVVVSE